MYQFINLNDIVLGEPSYSGHEVYVNAATTYPLDQNKKVKVIFKKNKYGNPQFSRLEAGFSKLAGLFLTKDRHQLNIW